MLRSTTLYVSVVFQLYLLKYNFRQVTIPNILLQCAGLVFYIGFDRIPGPYVLTVLGFQFVLLNHPSMAGVGRTVYPVEREMEEERKCLSEEQLSLPPLDRERDLLLRYDYLCFIS